MQVYRQTLHKGCTATDEHSLVIRICLDNLAIENGLDHVFAPKSFFQGLLHGMTFDEIVSNPYTFPDDFDVHATITAR